MVMLPPVLRKLLSLYMMRQQPHRQKVRQKSLTIPVR